MSETTPRFPDDFSIDVDGVTVRGRFVVRRQWEFKVEIVEPFDWFSYSINRRGFDRQHARDFDDQENLADKATSALGYLYYKARAFHENAADLRQLWDDYQAKLAELERNDPDSTAAVAADRRALRRRYRALGTPPGAAQREHQAGMKALREREYAYLGRQEKITDAFLASRPWLGEADLQRIVPFLERYYGSK